MGRTITLSLSLSHPLCVCVLKVLTCRYSC